MRLFITAPQLRQLLTRLDWSTAPAETVTLLEALKSTYDGSSLRVSFIEAWLTVSNLTRLAVETAAHIEDQASQLAGKELTLASSTTPNQSASSNLNIIDQHRLLSVLADLGEQLHQIAVQSEALPPATKQHLLGQTDLSRAHTALGRLASLLSLPSDK